MRIRVIRFLVGVSFSAPLLASAAAAYLSVQDAKMIVAELPEVRDAVARRRCPVLSVSSVTETAVEIAVRNFCVEWPDSGFLGRYTLTRRTGQVRDAVGRPILLSNEQMAQIQRLLEEESRARLTEAESTCAVSHLTRVIEFERAGADVTVRTTAALPNGDLQFQVLRTYGADHQMDQQFRVLFDPSTGIARDPDTGDFLDYADARLRSALLLSRQRPALEREEARLLAEEALKAETLSELRSCRLITEPSMDMGASYRFLTALGCPPSVARQLHLLVDMYSGMIQRADSGEIIDSPALTTLRPTLFEDVRQRQQNAVEYVRKHCAK
jgi:hypothetical protein